MDVDGAGAPQPRAGPAQRARDRRLRGLLPAARSTCRRKRISTCEALLRWPHPVRGMVSPAEFIPVAEEMGLIVEIGNWVLQQACLECARWPERLRVAVNLSPIQFRRGNVADARARGARRDRVCRPSRLEIEITESVLLQGHRAHPRTGSISCRRWACRISLDDFGTGYSSLSYLHSFPLEQGQDRPLVPAGRRAERPRRSTCCAAWRG